MSVSLGGMLAGGLGQLDKLGLAHARAVKEWRIVD
jgi:hypothetical protein